MDRRPTDGRTDGWNDWQTDWWTNKAGCRVHFIPLMPYRFHFHPVVYSWIHSFVSSFIKKVYTFLISKAHALVMSHDFALSVASVACNCDFVSHHWNWWLYVEIVKCFHRCMRQWGLYPHCSCPNALVSWTLAHHWGSLIVIKTAYTQLLKSHARTWKKLFAQSSGYFFSTRDPALLIHGETRQSGISYWSHSFKVVSNKWKPTFIVWKNIWDDQNLCPQKQQTTSN